MSKIFLWCYLFIAWDVNLYAASSQNPYVLVRGAADYSLMLSLVEGTSIEVRMISKHTTGCSCCQHGAPHNHMTVSEARRHGRPCVMPRLKQWTDLNQAIRIVKRWTHTLTLAFPEKTDLFLGNQEKILATLTQMQAKWQNVREEDVNDNSIDISPTLGGYVEALEKWFESQKVKHANRSTHTTSETRK